MNEAHARIFEMRREEVTDRVDWGEPIHTLPGHWDPHVALIQFCLNESPPEGTYRCESNGASATVLWDGEVAA